MILPDIRQIAIRLNSIIWYTCPFRTILTFQWHYYPIIYSCLYQYIQSVSRALSLTDPSLQAPCTYWDMMFKHRHFHLNQQGQGILNTAKATLSLIDTTVCFIMICDINYVCRYLLLQFAAMYKSIYLSITQLLNILSLLHSGECVVYNKVTRDLNSSQGNGVNNKHLSK